MARKTAIERDASFLRQDRARHVIDAFGVPRIDECRICKAAYVDGHRKYTTMCTECGKLYARYVKKSSKDSLTAGKKLVDRCKAPISEETRAMIEQIKKQEVNAIMCKQKVCRQCGRDLPVDAYRKYVSRGKGIYDTSTGYHTVCKECENFNQQVNNAYRKPVEARTQAQINLLCKAKTLYEALQRRGLEPKGRYAADVLGLTIGRDAVSSTDSYLASLLAEPVQEVPTQEQADEYLCRGNELLSMELTEEPDVYQDMVDSWRDSITGNNGKVKPEYIELFNKVAERIDTYEDNYTW